MISDAAQTGIAIAKSPMQKAIKHMPAKRPATAAPAIKPPALFARLACSVTSAFARRTSERNNSCTSRTTSRRMSLVDLAPGSAKDQARSLNHNLPIEAVHKPSDQKPHGSRDHQRSARIAPD